MPAPLLSEAATGSALAGAWQRLRHRSLRTLTVLSLLCLGIALILTAIDGRGFMAKLTYSLSIGAACVLVVDSVRLLMAWIADRLRIARGLPCTDTAATIGWRGVIPGALLSMVVGPPVGLWLGDRITGYTSPSLFSFGESSTRVTLALSVVATVISVAVLSALERASAARSQAEAAHRLAAESRLRLLQSQLEPHMLFNTLANLRVLVGIDPARAQAMLDHLIAFLRTTLDASRQTTQPLATEFKHLADYLALMAVRMGLRLQIKLDLPPELAALPVPPLLLQPLVENAIKHGLEPKVEGGRIEISARRDFQGSASTLRLTVRDTGAGLSPASAFAAGSSFGLEQVRARLATLYGERAGLALQAAGDAEGGALASLHLPLD